MMPASNPQELVATPDVARSPSVGAAPNEWLKAGQQPPAWLQELMLRADAAFVTRELAVWCAQRRIDSLPALLEERQTLYEHAMWCDLLASTRGRIKEMIEKMAPEAEPLETAPDMPISAAARAREMAVRSATFQLAT